MSIVVLVTGAPGSGRDSFLKCFFAHLDETERKRVQIIQFRDRLYDEIKRSQPGTTPSDETILSMDEGKLKAFRTSAILKIIQSDFAKSEITIISTPASFWKEGGWIDGLTADDVKLLAPSFICMILDDVARMKMRLDAHPFWGRKKLDFLAMANWRAKEEENTAKAAPGALPYLIPVDHPPSVLHDLIFAPSKKKAYFSFPITHMTKKERAHARMFCQKMREHYVIFDPLTIQDHSMIGEINRRGGSGNWKRESTIYCEENGNILEKPDRKLDLLWCSLQNVRRAQRALDRQIVDRDFHLVAQSDIIMVYYPVKDLAAGVICEMMYAKKHVQKQVYAFHPHKYSPFFEAMCADDFTGDVKIFRSAGKFSRFLRQIATT